MSRRPIPQVSITELWEHFEGEVIGSDSGLNRKAKCMLHEDRSASASVNEDEGLWRCHTCDIGGDSIKLIMEVKGVGFIEALDYAGSFAGGSPQPQRTSRSSLLPGGSRPSRQGSFVPPWRRM